MKLNRDFMIGVAVFLVLVFIAEMRMPAHFVWEPSFRHGDKQPFGCYVMDSLLSASLPAGYSVTDKTLYQLSQEKDTMRRSYVVLCYEFMPSKVEFNSMLRLLKRGDNVMILSGAPGKEFRDSILGINIETYSYLYNFKREMRYYNSKDSLLWVGDGTRYPLRPFYYDTPLIMGYIDIMDGYDADVLAVIGKANDFYRTFVDTIDVDTTAEYEYPLPCAVSVPYGKGKLVCCSNPLLFTNYGMLETGNQDFVFRMFSQLGNRPVVRTESVLESPLDGGTGSSPLAFFLRNQPLRWAIYTAMAGVLLYFVFSARRRQRVIPVMKAPENKSLEFVRLIGTLYHQRHDNTGLVRKKFLYFSDTLRRETMADIGNAEEDDRNATLIAEHTGMDAKNILAILHELRVAVEFEGNMTDEQIRHCIDMMNKITYGRIKQQPTH